MDKMDNDERSRNLLSLKADEETARAKRFRILEAECPGIKKATEALEGLLAAASWLPSCADARFKENLETLREDGRGTAADALESVEDADLCRVEAVLTRSAVEVDNGEWNIHIPLTPEARLESRDPAGTYCETAVVTVEVARTRVPLDTAAYAILTSPGVLFALGRLTVSLETGEGYYVVPSAED